MNILYVFVKKATIEKVVIKGKLHYLLTKKCDSKTAVKYAELNGGYIRGKKIPPTNASAYIRVIKNVCGKETKCEMQFTISEEDFENGKYDWKCKIVVYGKEFPRIEIPMPCDKVIVDKQLFKKMKEMAGVVTIGNH